ncbi:MAG: hypothetical protein U5L09_03610 [Bacteroidales bacterium]|nr:hypothetical protein [Bacteroidales bacterium]
MKSVYLSVFTLLMGLLFIGSNALKAQKFEDIDPVTYIQLPSLDAEYGTADVYILEEKDEVNKKLQGAFGKLAGKSDNETVKKGIEAFAKEALENKQRKYAAWKMLPDDFENGSGSGNLKVVISYLPDNMSKPMSEPMKNNDGEHVFTYRVNTKMMLYNDLEELILERDFGAVSGIGKSKNWPKNAGGAKAFGISTSDESDEKHPFEEACIEGAIKHAQRVVYGMYGVKEFEVPMYAMWAKSDKDTKDLAKDYVDIMEDKEEVTLSTEETGKVKSLVDKWEAALDKVDNDERWTIHYNLAAGYSWLVNPEKAKEHIAKVKELNKDIFDKIADKSGNWSTKDLKTLEAYNSLHPFAEYYAVGIKANPNYFSTPGEQPGELPFYAPGVAIARSIMISKQLGLPAIMPVHPMDFKADVRKADGAIKSKGKELVSLSYNYKKDEFESLQIKGENDFNKLKVNYETPDNSRNHPGHMSRFLEYFESNSIRADVHRKGENEFLFYDLCEVEFKTPFPVFATNEMEQEKDFQRGLGAEAKEQFSSGYTESHEYGFQQGRIKVITENGFYKEVTISSKSKWGFKNTLTKKGFKVYFKSDDYEETFKVTAFDKNGYPAKIETNYIVKDARFKGYASTKSKFGETTSKRSYRQDAADSKVLPKAKALIRKAVEENGGTMEQGSDDSHYNFKMTKTYDVSVEANDMGMWTKITIGDYELTREIK